MASSPNRSHKNPHEKVLYSLGNQEAMLIQDGYCSPERASYKDSLKQTPKSILKEYAYSGSKSKKGIIINETLNETRKLSLKSETSEALAAKNNQNTEEPKKAEKLRLQSNNINSFEMNEKNQEDNCYQLDSKQNLGPNWTSQDYNKEVKRDVYHKPFDFEKSSTRKQQRQREQEIYHEMIRRSSLNQAEVQDVQIENAELKKNVSYEENELLLKNLKQNRRSLNSRESKQSLQGLSKIGYIEEKIQQLEKCLDMYSNRLRESILRQRDQLLESHYGKAGDIESINYNEIFRTCQKQENYKQVKKNEQKDKQTKLQKSTFEQSSKIDLQSDRQWRELDLELKQLRQEKNLLKSKFPLSEEIWNSAVKQNENISDHIFEKEITLLKVVEQIKTKLYNSISQRSNQKSSNHSKASFVLKSDLQKTKTRKLRDDKDIKINNSSLPPRHQKVREAYGEITLERENACILNQGLSTTYNGFNWNANQSLKITRNI